MVWTWIRSQLRQWRRLLFVSAALQTGHGFTALLFLSLHLLTSSLLVGFVPVCLHHSPQISCFSLSPNNVLTGVATGLLLALLSVKLYCLQDISLHC